MKYAKNGSLRKNLPNIVKDKWIRKLMKLYKIIHGLCIIHQEKLIHCDFLFYYANSAVMPLNFIG